MHQEHRPPAELLGQESADGGAEAQPQVYGPHAESQHLAPLLLRVDRGQDGDPGAEDHGAPQPLEPSKQDQRQSRGRHRRQEGGQGVDGDSPGEEALAAMDVGQPPEGQQKHGGRQQKRGGHPAQRDRVHAEVLPDGGYGDIHRGAHEGDEEGGQGGDDQGDSLIGGLVQDSSEGTRLGWEGCLRAPKAWGALLGVHTRLQF